MNQPTVTDLLARLADVDDRGIHADDRSYSTWRQHIQDAADLAAALKARLDPAKPPHVGVLLGNTPFFSSLLVAAAMAGLVPVGLNPTRRGEALARDIATADCQLVLADGDDVGPQTYGAGFVPDGMAVIDVGSAAWADERFAIYTGAFARSASARTRAVASASSSGGLT
ncbi:MAG: AMP-binding protein, partial [Mycolicibacterium aromaticivorans]|nr:AMP-binding protein [Mycolicibacterium aromaticivorans]